MGEKSAEVLAVYGFDDSITGIKFRCKCGKTVTIEPVEIMCQGDVVECPYCKRKYTFEWKIVLRETN